VETLQSHQLGGRVSQVQQSPKLQQPVKSQSVAQKSQQPIQPPQPEVLTVEQLSHVLNQSKAIENWLKAVHAYALNELKNGREIPGWKLVAGRRSRKWKDDNKVADYFLSNGLLKEDQLYETKILSPAKVEKLLGKEAKKEKQFQSLINVVDGKPSLAKADDKRPALTFNSAKEDFKTVKQKE